MDKKQVFSTPASLCKLKFATTIRQPAIEDASQPKGAEMAIDAPASAEPMDATNSGTVGGYAIVYDVNTSDRGGYVCRFAKGSAQPAAEVHALYCHNPAAILGNTANNTLRIKPDDYGVYVEFDMPDTTDGRNVAALLGKDGKAGYVNGMSFGLVNGTSKTLKENGLNVVEYSTFTYDDVTVTPDPAVTETTVGMKDDNDLSDNKKKETYAERAKLDRYRLSVIKL